MRVIQILAQGYESIKHTAEVMLLVSLFTQCDTFYICLRFVIMHA